MGYQAGWYPDPTGRFDQRYYDGTNWTEHAARGEAQAVDVLDQPAPTPAPEGAPPADLGTAATAFSAGATKELPADPTGASRRKIMGWLMIGAAAVVLISLFLPWISASEEASRSDPPKELAGYQYPAAWACAVLAVGLGVYGWQGIGRGRVRFNVLALLGVIFLVIIPITSFFAVDDETLERLDAEVSDTPRIGVDDDTAELLDNLDAVEDEVGATVAVVAGLVTIIPLVVLWRDDRRRRAELLPHLPGVVVTQAAPAPAVAASPAAPPPLARPPLAPPPDQQPGWHADPTGRFELRYFDGSTWTEHVSRTGEQAVDPL